jgi:hypothetical protein
MAIVTTLHIPQKSIQSNAIYKANLYNVLIIRPNTNSN